MHMSTEQYKVSCDSSIHVINDVTQRLDCILGNVDGRFSKAAFLSNKNTAGLIMDCSKAPFNCLYRSLKFSKPVIEVSC